jgi:polar amino acid transport system permease protein
VQHGLRAGLSDLPRTACRRTSSCRNLALAYITFFRGTPLLCQLYLIYYGAGEFRPFLQSVGLWWFFREAFYCCILAFTMNTAAYQAEIMRGALNSVPKGQIEAATALGLSRYRVAAHM